MFSNQGHSLQNRGRVAQRRKAPATAPEARPLGKLERGPDGSLRTRAVPSQQREREVGHVRDRILPAMIDVVDELLREAQVHGWSLDGRKVGGFRSLRSTLVRLEGQQ